MKHIKKIFSPTGEPMLSARVAALRLGCAQDYVGKLCREGKLQGTQVHGAWFVDEASLTVFKNTRAEAKVSRSQELSVQRREEQKAYTYASYGAVRRLILKAHSLLPSVNIPHVARVLLVSALIGATVFGGNALLTREAYQNTSLSAALAQVESPFFGTGASLQISFGSLFQNFQKFVGNFFAPNNTRLAEIPPPQTAPAFPTTGTTVAKIPSAPTAPAVQNIYPIRERVVERIVAQSGVTEQMLISSIQQLGNSLRSEIYTALNTATGLPSSGGVVNNIALSQHIDKLNGVTITGSTISGYLPTSGGTVSSLSVTGNFALSALANCDTIDTDASGNLACGTDATGSGGGTFPFTSTTNFGALSNSTSTPIWFAAGLQASSTSQIAYASSTALTVSGTGYFGTASTTNLTISSLGGSAGQCLTTDSSGVVTTTTCGSGSGSFPFTSTTNYGALTNSTSTPIWFAAGLQASSTSYFANIDSVNATTTALYSSGRSIFAAGSGNVGIGTTTPNSASILHIDGGNSLTRMILDADAGNARIFSFRTDNKPRWAFRVDGTESGGNSGSDFAIRNYDDVGTLIDTPLFITRSTSNVGVGTTSPYAKLSVVGEAVASHFTATTTATSTFPTALFTNSTSTNFYSSVLTAGNATTTTFAISNIASGNLLKTTTNGSVIAAVAGTDYANFAYLFPSNATSTAIAFNGGLTTIGATSTGTFAVSASTTLAGLLNVGGQLNANLSAIIASTTLTGNTLLTNATTTNLFATTASTTNFYGAGLNTCQSGSVLTYDGSGKFGCAVDQTSTGAANDFTFTTNYATLTAATSSLVWFQNGITASSTSQIAYASSTALSVSGIGYFGTASTTNLTISNIQNSLLKTTAGGVVTAAVAGTDYITGSGLASAYPFQLAGNATSTLTQFNGGITAYASSTIGNSTQIGGLTVSGGATTTGNAYVAGTLGIATIAPTKTFEVTGTGKFSSTLTLGSVTSCTGGSALQTNGSGDISCGTVSSGGSSTGGGWTSTTGPINGNVTLATSTYIVAIGSGVTPTAKLSLFSEDAATTTLALYPASAQTANILNIFNTSGALYSVISAAGNFGLGSTTPAQLLSVQGNAFISGNITNVANITATGTLSIAGAITSTATAANILPYASSTALSVSGTGYFNTASTTNLTISSIASGSLLKTTTNGSVIAAVAGTDYANFAYLFPSNATSTAIAFNGGLTTIGATSTGTFAVSASTTLAGLLNIGGQLNANLSAIIASTTLTGSTLLTNATTTNLFATIASTTNFYGAGLNTCQSGNVLTYDGSGKFGCAADSTATGQANDFSFTANNYNTLAAATSSVVWFQNGIFASSTSHFVTADFANTTTTNATTTSLAITGVTSSLLKTLSSGAVIAAVAGTDYQTFAWPFSANTNYGAVANSTSTPIWFTQGLQASSTSHFALADFVEATSTSFFATLASTTNFYGAGLNTCQGGSVLTYNGSGKFGCAQDQTGTGAANDFAFTTNYGVLTAATSSPAWFQNGLTASSTSHFVYASSTALTVSGTGYFGTASTSNLTVSNLPATVLSTNGSGAVQATTISAPLSFSGSTFSISQSGTGSNGYLSSTDFSTFNNKISSTSLSGAYPIAYNSSTGVISTNFSTTTQNNFNAHNTFTSLNAALASTTNATTTTFYTSSYFAGANLSTCNTAADKLLWAGGIFTCGTDSGASGSDLNWTHFNGTGIRVTTATDQVLIGFTSTSTLSKLEVVGGATIDNATTTNFAVSGTLNAGSGGLVYLSGNVGIGTTSPSQKLALAGGNLYQIASGSPTLAATVATAGTTYATFIAGRYAYVAEDAGGLRIVDISAPRSPVTVGTYALAGAKSVVVAGKYAYVGDTATGLNIIDVSNASAPALVGTYGMAGTFGIALSGKYAYVTDFTAAAVRIIDVSNPVSPTLVGSVSVATSKPYAVAVSGKYLYIADQWLSAIYTVDVSNPSAPARISTYTGTGAPSALYVSGKYLYVGDDGKGFYILDIKNPNATPTVVGTYNPTGSYYGVVVAGDYAYLADHTGNITVLDVHASTSPSLVGTLSTGGIPWGLAVSGKYGYVAADTSGLKIIDLNGAQIPLAHIGSLESNSINVSESLVVGNNIFAGGGLDVGISGIFSRGIISAFIASTTQTNPTVANFMGGNVGVGTTSPYTTLSVVGGAFVSGNFNTANLTATGTLTVSGAASLQGATSTALAVTGSTTISSILNIGGALNANLSAIIASTTLTGSSLFTNATTTSFAISNIANSSLLKTATNGSIIAAVAGTDYVTGAGLTSAFPFTQTTHFGINANSTSTPIFFTNRLFASSTSYFDAASFRNGLSIGSSTPAPGALLDIFAASTTATTTLFKISSTTAAGVNSTLFTISNTGLISGLNLSLSGGATTSALSVTGSSTITGQFNAVGGATFGTLSSTGLATLASLTVSGAASLQGATSTALAVTGSSTISSILNIGGALNANLSAIIASTTLTGSSLFTNATTTSFAISNIANSSLLKTATNGSIIAAVAGTDYVTGAGLTSAFPFTQTTHFGINANSTSTPIFFANRLFASSTSYFDAASFRNGLSIGSSTPAPGALLDIFAASTTATTTLFKISSTTAAGVNSTLFTISNTGLISGLNLSLSGGATTSALSVTGSSTITGQFNAVGGATFGTLTSSGLATLSSLTVTGATSLQGATSTSLAVTGSTTISSVLNIGGALNANLSALIASTTLTGNSLFSNATTTSFAISNIANSSLLKTATNGSIIAAVAGTDYANFAFPYTPTTNFGLNANSTSTPILFTQGIFASSTSRFASATFAMVGVGSTSPYAMLSIHATSTATTTLFAIGSSTPAGQNVTLFSVSGIGSTTLFQIPSSLLKTNSSGTIVAAVAGTDYITGAGLTAAFPFTATTNFGLNANSTSTPIFFANRLFASSTSYFDAASFRNGLSIGSSTPAPGALLDIFAASTTATTTLFKISSTTAAGVNSTLFTISNTGLISGLNLSLSGGATTSALSVTGSSTITGQFNAVGGATFGTLSSTGLATLASLTVSGAASLQGATSTALAVTGSSTISSILNIGGALNANLSAIIASTTLTGSSLFTNATTTSFAISNIANSSLLKTATNGSIIAAVAGTDYVTGAGLTAAFPFTATTNFGINANSTSTPIFFTNRLFASSTSYFDAASFRNGLSIGSSTPAPGALLDIFAASTTATTTLFKISSTTAAGVNSTLFTISNTGLISGLNLSLSGGATTSALSVTGSSTITGQFNAVGGATFGTLSSTGLATLASLTVSGATSLQGATSTSLAVTGSSTITSVLNIGGALNANLSAIIASTTLTGSSLFTNATTTSFAISNIANSSLLKTATNGSIIAAVAGTDYVTGAGLSAAYPFQLTGNATSTLTQFNGGLTAYASSTVGNGTQTGGLTISGGATTTLNAYFAGDIGVRGSTPVSRFNVGTPETLTISHSNNIPVTIFDGDFGPYIVFRNTAADTEGTIGVDSAGVELAAVTNSPITFFTNNSSRMRLSAAGGLSLGTSYTGTDAGENNLIVQGTAGIGTTSPFSKLAIHANSLESNLTLFAIGSSTASATSTLFSVSNTGTSTLLGTASSTGLIVSGLNAASCDVKADTNGRFSCGTDATGAGAANPFTWEDNFGVVSAATTSALWAKNGLFASSTSRFTDISTTGILNFATTSANASSTLLSFNGQTFLTASTTGFNTGLGQNALANITSGINNTALGYNALKVNTSGEDNTAVGQGSLDANTSGQDNSAFGRNALGANSTQNSNSAFGSNALAVNNGGDNNNAFGYLALDSNTSGSLNSSFGSDSLTANTIGFGNSAFGYRSLLTSTTGYFNVALGYLANQTNTVGTSTTILGSFADVGANNLSTSTAIGAGALVSQNNSLVLGGLGQNAVFAGVGTTSPFARLSIHANTNDSISNTTLFAIGSSTASATTTLFSISNTGLTTITNSGAQQLTLSDNISPNNWSFRSVSGNLYIATSSASTLATSTYTAFTLASSSNVGIGTANPWGRLAVSSANLAQTWQLVAASTSVTTGTPALAALSPNRVAFIDDTNDTLRTYEFNGTTWTQVGSGLGISGVTAGVSIALAALSPNRVAYIDPINDSLRVYESATSTGNWIQIGDSLTISNTSFLSLAALSPNRVAFFDFGNKFLRVYEFNGTTWAQVGGDFSISGGQSALAALSPNRVAFIDDTNDTLRTYEFNGTTWTQVGSSFAIVSTDNPALAALSPNRVAFIDNGLKSLRVYEFNGTTWALVGSSLGINTVGTPALAALSPNRVAFIDDTNDMLSTYQFSSPLLYIANSQDYPYLSVSDAGYTTAEGLSVRTGLTVGQSATSTWATSTPALIVNGTSVFSGLVGIGTSSPWAQLSIVDNQTSTSSVLFAIASSTANFGGLATTSGPALFVVNSKGSVGIGTSSPYARLSLHAGATDHVNTTLFAISSSTSAFATSTLFKIDNTGTSTLLGTASSTGLIVSGLNAASCDVKADTNGRFSCGTDSTSAGQNPFTWEDNFGVVAAATTSPIWAKSGIFASSTSRFTDISTIGILNFASTSPNASSTLISVNGRTFLIASTTNTALGVGALERYVGEANGGNTAVGQSSLSNVTTGYQNTAVGWQSLFFNNTGINNVALGMNAATYNMSDTNVAVGVQAGQGFDAFSAKGTTVTGYQAGIAFGSGADYNTLYGYKVGANLTSGYSNIVVGTLSDNVTQVPISTGSGNIGIGNNVFFPSATANNQLNIGNVLFGSLPATSTAFRLPTTGSIGIATSSPFATLSVHANNGSTKTTLFAIGSSTASATSTLFSISNTGLISGLNLSLSGGATTSALSVTGSSTITGQFNAVGGATFGTLSSTGLATLASLTVSGATSLQGATSTSLAVTGSSTITSVLNIGGALNANLSAIIASTTLTGSSLFTNATTTSFAISNIANSSLLKTATNGSIIAAVAGTDYVTGAGLTSAFPYTQTTHFGINANSTSTPIFFANRLFASSTSYFDAASFRNSLSIGSSTPAPGALLDIFAASTTATTTLFKISSTTAAGVNSTLFTISNTGLISGLNLSLSGGATTSALSVTGSSTITGQFNAVGGATFGTLSSTGLATLASLTVSGATSLQGATSTSLAVTGSSTITSVLNIGGALNANLSALIASTTLTGSSLFTNATTTSFAISNIANSSLLKTATNGSIIAAVAGTDYVTGAGLTSAFPFTQTTHFGINANSTSTPIFFANRLFASSTSQFDAGIFRTGLSVGSTTPYAYFSIHAASTTATTTLFAIGSTTSAGLTSTLFTISNTGTSTLLGTASSTGLIVSGLNAASCDVKADTNGRFSCGTDATGSGGADFTWESNFGVISAATTSPIWAKSGIFASSTSYFNNANFINATSTGTFAVTGSTTLAGLLNIGGALNANSTLTVTGNSSLQSATSTSLFANTLTANVARFGQTATSTFTSAGWLGIGTSTPNGQLTISNFAVASTSESIFFNITASTTDSSSESFQKSFFKISYASSTEIFGKVIDPRFVSEEQGPTPGTSLDNANSVFVSGNYAYVSNSLRDSLAVIDISNPADPVFISEELGPTPGTSLDGAPSVFVSGNYAYVTNSTRDSLAVIDISNPADPVFISEELGPTPGTSLDGAIPVFVSGNYAYVANLNRDSLAVIDISNPADPVFISEELGPTPGTSLDGAQGVFVSGNYAYVSNSLRDSLAVIDISNPADPVFISEELGPTPNTSLNNAKTVFVSGNYAYVANQDRDSLAVLDISNPADPVFVSEELGPTPGTSLDGAHRVFVSGNYAYVANLVRGSLAVIDISNPADPVFVSEERGPTPGTSLGGAQSVFVSGNYAYVANSTRDSLAVIDVGGATISNLAVGTAKVGNLQVDAFAQFAAGGLFGGGLGVQGSIFGNSGATFLRIGTTTPLASTTLAWGSNYVVPPALSAIVHDANIGSISDVFSITHTATSSALSGIGTGMLFNTSTFCSLANCAGATTTATSTSRIASIFTNVSTSTPQSALTFSTKNSSAGLTEYARLTSTGSFGIGTTSPWGQLSVNPNGITGPAFVIGSSTQTLFKIDNTGTSTLLGTASSTGLIVSSAGGSAGCATFAADGRISNTGTACGSGSAGADFTFLTVNSAIAAATTSPLAVFNNSYFGATGTTTITSAGFVGVGTTTPYARLTVWGSNSSAGTNSFLVANAASTTLFAVDNDGIFTYGKASTSTVPNNNPYAWTIATSTTGTPLFRIDTTTGAEQLTVGASGADLVVGDVGNASNIVFEENSTIRGQGSGRTITFGANSDVLKYGISSLVNCSGGNAITTDSSGIISCGSITVSGAAAGGGWTASGDSVNGKIIQATSTYMVGLGATTTPYAQLSVRSASTATTTLALQAALGQTANILDIYGTNGALSTVFTAREKFGLSTTSPFAKFSIHATSSETNLTLFAIGSSTASATTTLFSISNTGSTTLASTFGTCSGANALTTNSSGTIVCNAITATGDGVGTWFTPTTHFGAAANSTSTPIFFANRLFASSTSQFDAANFRTGLSVGSTSPFAYFSIHATGTLATTTLFAIGSTTGAGVQSTLFSISNTGLASSTALVVSSAGGSGTRCAQFAADGTISANASACGSGGGTNPFTWEENFGVISAATTSALWAKSGIFASSTSVIASTTFAINGNVGIGTTSPWAKLSIITNDYANEFNPAFVIATTSAGNSGQWPLFYVGATTTGALDYARVAIGTTTGFNGASGLRDQLTVAGRIYSTWQYLSCDSGAASAGIPVVIADTSSVCGNFAFDLLGDGTLTAIGGYPAYTRMIAGANASLATNEGAWLRTTAGVAFASTSPVMEARVRIPAEFKNATSSRYIVGFTSIPFATSTTAGSANNIHTRNGAYFLATTTGTNWGAVLVKNDVQTVVDTGYATTSNDFYRMRIEMASSSTTFLINGAVVAIITPPAAGSPAVALSPMISVSATGTQAGQLGINGIDIAYMRVWVDDPPEGGSTPGDAVAGAPPGEALPEKKLNQVEGASIAQDYLADDGGKFVEGVLVSNATSSPWSTSGLVQLSSGKYDSGLIGVVSLSPRVVLGEWGASTVRVGMVGRVPTIVSLENGPIAKGDRIAASSIEGVGMRASRAGFVVGTALESFATSTPAAVQECDPSLVEKLQTAGVAVPADACLAMVLVTLNPGSDSSIGNIFQDIGEQITDMAGATLELANAAFEQGAQLTKFVVGQVVAKVAVIGELFATTIHAENIYGKKLCLSDDEGVETCITKAELDALLSGQAAAPAAAPPPEGGGGGGDGSPTSADTEAPVITVNGNNPATIEVGVVYSDLGATVSDNVDSNLGLYASVDGGEPRTPDQIYIDTATAGTHTIIYSATDSAGNVGTATRTVEVVSPAPPVPSTVEGAPEPAPEPTPE